MTTYRYPINTRASIVLVLVIADVILVKRTSCNHVRHNHQDLTDYRRQTRPRSDDMDRPAADEAAALRDGVLRALGLQEDPVAASRSRGRRPPAVERVAVPDYMWRLYRRQRKANREGQSDRSGVVRHQRPERTANTIRSFLATSYSHTDAESHRRERRSTSLQNTETMDMAFNVSNSLLQDILHAAELRLFLDFGYRKNPDEVRHYRVSVYQVLDQPMGAGEDPASRLLDTKVIRESSGRTGGRWVSLDVRPAVATWQHRGEPSNRGLRVTVTSLAHGVDEDNNHFRFRRSSPTSAVAEVVDRQPILVTYADDRRTPPASSMTSHRKRKRSASGRRGRKSRRAACRRRPLYVDFAEVEWNDWIIAPPGYHAFVCSGVCPTMLPDHLNATNHAQVQSLLHSVSSRLVPAPCCVPTSLSAISMLYVDETDKVVLRNYRDMVVESCGCR